MLIIDAIISGYYITSVSFNCILQFDRIFICRRGIFCFIFFFSFFFFFLPFMLFFVFRLTWCLVARCQVCQFVSQMLCNNKKK